MSTAPITIQAGDLVVHDPDATKLYHFDWTDRLGSGVALATAETVITLVRPAGNAAAFAALTTSNETTSLATHQIELATPQRGAIYRITSRITTDETPAQSLDGSFFLKGEDE
jgi:hypothetical protein